MTKLPSLPMLPFGLLELNEQAIVIGFSPIGESYSTIRAEEVIGRDFFKEIVPFAEAEETREKFHTFMKHGDSHERLFFTFRSEQGDVSVQVALAFLPEREPTRLAIVRLMPEQKEGQPR